MRAYELLATLRKGISVECPACKKGNLKPPNGDYKKSHYFTCDKCGESMIVN